MTSARLAAARGAVRDGAAAVDSFAQLLGSRRVGPRGIARALPEVREGCTTLRAALEELDGAFAQDLSAHAGSAAAASAVLSVAGAEVAVLEAELTRAEDDGGRKGAGKAKGAPERPLDARQRLALEALVRRTSRELGVALYLTDLLSAALDLRPTPLSLTDLLRARGATVAQAQPAVRVVVQCEAGSADGLDADPHVVGPLLEIAVAVASRGAEAGAWLHASRRADGRLEVRVGQARGGARPEAGSIALDLPLRQGDERAQAVACAAALLAGIALALPAEAPLLPQAPPGGAPARSSAASGASGASSRDAHAHAHAHARGAAGPAGAAVVLVM